MRRTHLRSIPVAVLVAAWLLASMAPGVLATLSVGARMVTVSAEKPHQTAATVLAVIRGELCGMVSETQKARDRLPDEQPLTEVNSPSVFLTLVESQPVLIHPVKKGAFERPSDRIAYERRPNPPSPPPRAV